MKRIDHSVRVPYKIFVIIGISYELAQSLYVGAPIGSEHRVYRKALIAFVVPKYAILEELIGQFGPVFVFNFIVELIVNDADPRADAGQRPYIKRYIGIGKSFQNPDVQPGRWTATAERDGSSAVLVVPLFGWVAVIDPPLNLLVSIALLCSDRVI